MTRKEERIEAAKQRYGEDTQYLIAKSQAFLVGAKWADETMIDKACLYLKEALINTRDNFGYEVVASFDTIDLDGFIEEFRKELKGE